MARAAGVPATYRDVFLDNVVNALAIRDRFAELVAIARENGTAVAIGHPHPQTLGVLRRELPRLSRQGVQLVSLNTLIARRFRQPVQMAQSSPSRVQADSTR